MSVCPRTACPVCDRPTALMPTSRTGYGALDGHKRERGHKSLILCAGSMVQLPNATATAWQEQLPEDSGPPAALGGSDEDELRIF